MNDVKDTTHIHPEFVNQLALDFPEFTYKVGKQFYWSPKHKTVWYKPFSSNDNTAKWALVHEVSHAVLGHRTYSSDFELLKLEVDAWQKAEIISNKYNLSIDPEHIQDCLDTYRDWLYRRSSCPQCGLGSAQISPSGYKCHSCGQTWNVSKERFCRPYRATTA